MANALSRASVRAPNAVRFCWPRTFPPRTFLLATHLCLDHGHEQQVRHQFVVLLFTRLLVPWLLQGSFVGRGEILVTNLRENCKPEDMLFHVRKAV